MKMNPLEAKFARIGARLKLGPGNQMRVDIREDRKGEAFFLQENGRAEIEVLDVQPADRHLLLMFREGLEKSKFLCGHDERHWFVAAVPESAAVGTVRAAKEALKPSAVKQAQDLAGLRASARNRRKNAAFRRQGEWFFVPAPELKVDPSLVLRDEPLRRGGGKAHFLEYCLRIGGETVHVCHWYPNGLTETAYRQVLRDQPRTQKLSWTTMRRDPEVYARGRVRHADHKTITLPGWHRVWMNTETRARAMSQVAFLD